MRWVCARRRVCVWPDLSPDVSLSLVWHSIDLYGNTACSRSRPSALALLLISTQQRDVPRVLSLDCVWDSCDFIYFFYQLMCTAKRRWRQDCATATWDHQVNVCVLACVCVCVSGGADLMCWSFNITVWTHICLLVSGLINFWTVNSHTPVNLSSQNPLGETLSPEALSDTLPSAPSILLFIKSLPRFSSSLYLDSIKRIHILSPPAVHFT